MQEKYKWYLAATASVIVIGVCIVGFVSSGNNEAPPKKETITEIRPNPPIEKTDEIREQFEAAKNYEPPDPDKKIKDSIKTYRARIEKNPNDPETPALLDAMGNLYAYKLGDYEMAASCYDQLLHRFPDYKRGRTFVNLETCLEKSGDIEGATRICREIRKEFSEDSEVFQWAVEKVSKDIWEMSSRVPETLPVATEEQAPADSETNSENTPRN